MKKMLEFLLALAVLAALLCAGDKFRTYVSVQQEQVSRSLVVLDPGHGGRDPGKIGVNGEEEKDLNLAVALRTREVLKDHGIEVVMTREEFEIHYPQDAETTRQRKNADQKSRLTLVNSQENGILLSIHQNQFTSPGVWGPQVFYNPGNGAQALAERLQALLNTQLAPESRRVAAPISEEVLLTRESDHPAVLVECGFLSNAAEAALLGTPEYQLQLSLILVGGYLQHITLTPEDTDEG